jgi:hypothetical protein
MLNEITDVICGLDDKKMIKNKLMRLHPLIKHLPSSFDLGYGPRARVLA